MWGWRSSGGGSDRDVCQPTTPPRRPPQLASLLASFWYIKWLHRSLDTSVRKSSERASGCSINITCVRPMPGTWCEATTCAVLRVPLGPSSAPSCSSVHSLPNRWPSLRTLPYSNISATWARATRTAAIPPTTTRPRGLLDLLHWIESRVIIRSSPLPPR